jgi:hypothetical protein
MGRKKLLPVDDDDDEMVSRRGGAEAHPSTFSTPMI